MFKYILFENDLDPLFKNYPDKYYGIGFQILSQPIQLFLSDIILKFQDINNFGAHLLAKHFVVFLTSFYNHKLNFNKIRYYNQ